MSTRRVIAVAGRIASGKTTIAGLLARKLGAGYASFGDVVRAEIRSRGLSETRAVLQVVGQELVDEDPEGFCTRVLEQSGWPFTPVVVLDGLRHCDVLETLRNLSLPAQISLVYVHVPDHALRARLAERGEQQNLSSLEASTTERQVATVLRSKADIVVDGTTNSASGVSSILKKIEPSLSEPGD